MIILVLLSAGLCALGLKIFFASKCQHVTLGWGCIVVDRNTDIESKEITSPKASSQRSSQVLRNLTDNL